jgi:hypothetical protein
MEMTNPSGFAHAIASIQGAKIADQAVLVAWFLSETSRSQSCSIDEVVSFLSSWGVRPNINKSRLKEDLRRDRRVTVKEGRLIHVPLSKATEYRKEYKSFLAPPDVEIEDRILQLEEFSGKSKYIQGLVRQINACHQIGAFDGCAVMMRRLAEALIILAFNKVGKRGEILDSSGNYLRFDDLLSALFSSKDLKISRGSPAALNQVKKVGDRAAHSTNYLTSDKDIDLLSADFRALISDLISLTE